MNSRTDANYGLVLPELEEWNRTQANYPVDVCIHHLVEAQVERTPHTVAVLSETQQLTYQELNWRANQVAHYLKTLGVGTECLVGVYLDRSPDMIVSLLGILKAGAAYIPLDPAYPRERIAFVLEDARVSTILTHANLAETLADYSGHVVCLDSDSRTIAQHSRENVGCTAIASNLMYVIYTSGSTGRPKGVMITHAGICNQLHWRQSTFPLTAADRVLQNISFSFDPSVWQIFWPLSFGAQLVLPRPDGQKDIAYLVRLIAEHRITIIALVPSMLRVLLEEKNLNESCQSLKHIFCGGEALQRDLEESCFAHLHTDVALHNVYGPTEASIDATFWTCKEGGSHLNAPIGRPISNAQAYILDHNLQVVPVGEPGELHIGGIGLARGYLNRPELTAEKFIPHPFDITPGARLYKTGDLARYLPDGNIEFLGRIDHQVKVRGFRIELGEIEAVLSQHPDLQQSIVTVREDRPGDKRLVAYSVVIEGTAPTVSDLRHFLADKLPDHMIPSTFVWLDALPLNPNGKVDRNALPPPKQDRVVEVTPVAPQDLLERQLIEIWEQVLRIKPIGAQDNFFELGGSSLLALSALNLIEATLNWKLPLNIFVSAPTIKDLADHIRTENKLHQVDTVIPLKSGSAKHSLFCIYGELIYYELSQALNLDCSVYGVYLQDEVDTLQACRSGKTEIPKIKVDDLAARYLQKIRSIQPEGPYYLAGLSFGGLVAFEMAQQLLREGEVVEILALFDTPALGPKKVSFWMRFIRDFKVFKENARLYKAVRLLQIVKFADVQVETLLKGMGDRLFKRWLANLEQSVQENLHHKVVKQAMRMYSAERYSGKTILFRALDQDRSNQSTEDPQLWHEYVENLRVYDIPGDHLSILKEPHVHQIAEKLQAHMET